MEGDDGVRVLDFNLPVCAFCVSIQVLSALDILQPPQIDCFEEMYLFLCVCELYFN